MILPLNVGMQVPIFRSMEGWNSAYDTVTMHDAAGSPRLFIIPQEGSQPWETPPTFTVPAEQVDTISHRLEDRFHHETQLVMKDLSTIG